MPDTRPSRPAALYRGWSGQSGSVPLQARSRWSNRPAPTRKGQVRPQDVDLDGNPLIGCRAARTDRGRDTKSPRWPGLSSAVRIDRSDLDPARTGPMRLQIKSPLLRSSTLPIYQHLYASTLAIYRQPPEAECRPLTGATALYRDIRANMEQTPKPHGLDHRGRIITIPM